MTEPKPRRYGTVLITEDAPERYVTAILEGCTVLCSSANSARVRAYTVTHPEFDEHEPFLAPQYIAFIDPETGKRGPWRRASWG